MGTLKEFIEKHNITITSERVPLNPNMPADPKDAKAVKWEKEAAHFYCTLGYPVQPLSYFQGVPRLHTTRHFFSMGSGHARLKNPKQDIHHWTNQGVKVFPNPTAEQVLDCLITDASCWESNRTFEDFCAELGYDTDSRKAERVYQACGECYKQLLEWLRPLGRDVLHELLYETERL